MSEKSERETENERLYRVTMTLCGGCLDAVGSQCHNPGCAFIRRSSLEWPLRGQDYDESLVQCVPLEEVVQFGAEFESMGRTDAEAPR